MNNTELYINDKLVDTGGDLGVRLNRKLIDPGALNTVDAQFSFSISLPPTQRNGEAFNYANVEETRDKFNRVYKAELIVNAVRVFGPGMFRLTNVTAQGFKGQLYMPTKKTVKDIFGDLMLNQNAPFDLPFVDFAEYINLYNAAAATEPQPAIFPFVMYGVLPKTPLNKNANVYSARTLWDASVRLGMSDLAPAINPLIMLQHIFNSRGYTLQGTAFQDDKLAKLYHTYKNAPDYVQPWNYGQHAKINISGLWSSRYNKRTDAELLEKGVNQGSDDTGVIYACDFLDATNTKLEINEDTGGNVLYTEVNDADGTTWASGQIRVPTAGFYKVVLGASLRVHDTENWRSTDATTGVQHIGGVTSNAKNWFTQNLYEIRLCRDRGARDFGLSGPKLNGSFYYENQPQNDIFDGENIPKYFPQVDANGQVNFIDLAQDSRHLLGFNFGRNESNAAAKFKNPQDTTDKLAQVQAAKPALSWDAAEDTDKPTRLAIKSPGYWKFGRIGTFDNAGDNPNIDLDYSAGPFATGKILDINGNVQDPATGNLSVRFTNYALNNLTGFVNPRTGWETSDFIDVAAFTNIEFSAFIGPGSEDVAVVAFYDANLLYIGAGVSGDVAAQIFTNEPLTLPSDAAYVRISGNTGTVLHSYPLDYSAFTDVAGGAGGQEFANKVPLVNPGSLATFRVKGSIGATITPYAYEIIDSPLGKTTVHTYPSFVTTSADHTEAISDGFVIPAGYYVGYKSTTGPTYGTVAGDAWQLTPTISIYTGLHYAYDFVINENTASTFDITADSVDQNNIILERFALARYYTYKIETPPGSGYEGTVYVHNGSDIAPVLAVPIVGGAAEFNTALAPLAVFDPKLTIYLKAPNFDVDGTLTISREITPGSEDVVGWELSNKYNIDLINAPLNYAKRGQFDGVAESADWYAQGEAAAVVWLEAGELLTVASVASEGRYRRDGMHSTFGWVAHDIKFDLSVQPFRTDAAWLLVGLNGTGTGQMDWDDAPNFETDSINLVGFLSADTKTDEYIDNLCKAYNLALTQISATAFSLDVKQSKTAVSSLFIDLDKLASVTQRENTPLGLPSRYVLGFTIDQDEEGFAETGETGGGTFDTGATEGDVVTQVSAFSYNWYKAITKVETGGDIIINLPIVSKAAPWDPAMTYPDAMKNRYTDLAYRFMYYGGILPGTYKFNGEDLQIAQVQNDLPGVIELNYKNKLHTILWHYFNLLINGASHYTNLKGFISAPQYAQLDGTLTVKFNGDMYYAAELAGYDPNNRNQTNIKLIRKI